MPACAALRDLELVNGYFCRNCADVELAKKGIDPAHPTREVAGSEVYVPPKDDDPRQNLGVNAPEPGADVGSRLNLYA